MEIQTRDVVLVAEADGLCGFIAVWCRPAPHIDNLHVQPSFRSRKIGTLLLVSATQELLARQHKTADLWAFKTNLKAIRFYERMGGVVAEEAPQDIFGYSIPSVRIEWKDLSVILTITAPK